MMNYFQKKKLAFMSIVNRVKGFVRTVTGTLPLMLEGCVDGKSIIDYTIYGQGVQDGTPTPEAPVEVESVGEYDETSGKYKIPITVSGKNLCNPTEIVTNGRIENEYVYGSDVDIWVKAGTHRLTFNYGGGVASTFYFRKGQVNSGYISSADASSTKKTSVTFTFTEDDYLRISHFGNKDTAYFYNFMLVDGTKSVDYEPYHEPITTNIYLDEPLRKVGDYADYIDFENGKIVRNVEKYTFTGKETDMGGATNDPTCFGYVIHLSNLSLSSNKVGLCNYLKQGAVSTVGANRFAYHGIANHPYVYVFFKKTDFPELETYSPTTAKQIVKQMYDSGVPMIVYYNRNKPTETPITLPTIPTFKGTSIISADTTIQPSNAEIEYYSNVKE